MFPKKRAVECSCRFVLGGHGLVWHGRGAVELPAFLEKSGDRRLLRSDRAAMSQVKGALRPSENSISKSEVRIENARLAIRTLFTGFASFGEAERCQTRTAVGSPG